MPNIKTLSVLTIDDKTIDRQLALGDNAEKRNYLCERAVQTQSRKLESLRAIPESSTNKRQDVYTQSQHKVKNITEPSVISNPMVMVNNNNENNFLSELTINQNQSFVSEQLRKDDTVAKQASQRDNDNSERFISDQSKDPDIEAKTI